MKLASIGAAVIALAIAGSAQAQAEEGANPATNARNTGTPSGSRLLPNGQNADVVQKSKAKSAKAKASAVRKAFPSQGKDRHGGRGPQRQRGHGSQECAARSGGGGGRLSP